jgi:hypothetical protein
LGSIPFTEVTLSLPEDLTPFMPYTEFEIISDSGDYTSYRFFSDYPNWLIAGDYAVQTKNAGSLELVIASFKEKAKTLSKTDAVDILLDAVDYFSELFGPLDFAGRPCILAELDASVGGGWAIDNMSIFSETMFLSSKFQADPAFANREGGSGIGVAVHEIAHQWWGWGPDSVFLSEDGESPWSAEGLTVYSTYLYMKHRFGEEYAKREFTDIWEKNAKMMKNSFYSNNMPLISVLPRDISQKITESYTSTTFYDLMPYLLLKAETHVGGEAEFLLKLKDIQQHYRKRDLDYAAFLKLIGVEEGLTLE